MSLEQPKVFTIQMAKWRKADAMGMRILDTTVKSGIHAFAPSWDMVMGHKNGSITDRQYRLKYDEMMNQSKINNPEQWKNLLRAEYIVLACYCKAGNFCHRHFLKTHILTYLRENGKSPTDAGEIQ